MRSSVFVTSFVISIPMALAFIDLTSSSPLRMAASSRPRGKPLATLGEPHSLNTPKRVSKRTEESLAQSTPEKDQSGVKIALDPALHILVFSTPAAEVRSVFQAVLRTSKAARDIARQEISRSHKRKRVESPRMAVQKIKKSRRPWGEAYMWLKDLPKMPPLESWPALERVPSG